MWWFLWVLLAAVLGAAVAFYRRFYVRLPNEPPYVKSPKGMFAVPQEYGMIFSPFTCVLYDC
jgi:hypothetical protein